MDGMTAVVPEQMGKALEDIYEEVSGWQDTLFSNGVWYTLISAVLVGVMAFAVTRILGRVVRHKDRGNLRFFYRLINAVIIFVSVLMVMMTITPMASLARALLAGSGLLAVVIGIAAQAALSNVFSGISIGISRPFIIGETIDVVGQDISGVVTEMNLRQTIIRDLNNKYIVVPNAVLDKAVIRAVQRAEHSVVNHLTLGIAYNSDIDLAIRIIREAVIAHPDFFDMRTQQQRDEGDQKDVAVLVADLAASSIKLHASVWSKDAGTGFTMLSDLRRTIFKRFIEENIEMPYASGTIRIRQARTEE